MVVGGGDLRAVARASVRLEIRGTAKSQRMVDL